MESPIRLSLKRWENSTVIGLVLVICTIQLFSQIVQATEKSETPLTRVESACTANEQWSFDSGFQEEIPPGFLDEFHAFLLNKISVARSFSEALALRKIAHSERLKLFSEYWISRSLYEGGLIEISTNAFNTLVSREPSLSYVGIQMAALECLTRVHSRYSVLGFSRSTQSQIRSYFRKEIRAQISSPVLLEAGTQLFLEKLEKNQDLEEAHSILGLFKGSGIYESYLRGVFAIRLGRNQEAINDFLPLLTGGKLPKHLSQQMDQIRLFLARSYYATGEFQKAIEQYKSIGKNKEEFPQILSELSWAQLRAGKYPEAIGIGISIQSGWMKFTFTPEPLMVSAIALNEICRYPEALRMITVFRREYKNPFHWLQVHSGPSLDEKSSLYRLAISFLKKDPVADSLPKRVANEWIRSPVFLSHQEGLNLIINENRAIRALGKSGQKEQKDQVLQLLGMARKLRNEYRMAKIRMKPGDEMPYRLKDALGKLRVETTHYNRFTSAAPIWRTISEHFKMGVPTRQSRVVTEIEDELHLLNKRMYQQINEIMENNELIEVEIYNGASTDIVWKNAHPDSKTKTQPAQGSQGHSLTPAAETYDWGNTAGSLNNSGRALGR